MRIGEPRRGIRDADRERRVKDKRKENEECKG
jgi:hypothetical protein